jgi:hypothetical protein
VVLIQPPADESFDHRMTAHVEFGRHLVELLEHGGGEIHIHPLKGMRHLAAVREETRHIFASVGA